jgi:hypothetical protein
MRIPRFQYRGRAAAIDDAQYGSLTLWHTSQATGTLQAQDARISEPHSAIRHVTYRAWNDGLRARAAYGDLKTS